MKTIVSYFVRWETTTRRGQTRSYMREFVESAKPYASALYLSKSRDQYPILYKCTSVEIRPAYTDENSYYHAEFTRDTFEILRKYGD